MIPDWSMHVIDQLIPQVTAKLMYIISIIDRCVVRSLNRNLCLWFVELVSEFVSLFFVRNPWESVIVPNICHAFVFVFPTMYTHNIILFCALSIGTYVTTIGTTISVLLKWKVYRGISLIWIWVDQTGDSQHCIRKILANIGKIYKIHVRIPTSRKLSQI